MATPMVILTDIMNPSRPQPNLSIRPLPPAMIAEVAAGDYLADDHMNKFGEILTLVSNGTFRPQEVLLIQAVKYVHPVTSRHIQLLSGINKNLGDITHWICTYYDGKTIYVYDSLN